MKLAAQPAHSSQSLARDLNYLTKTDFHLTARATLSRIGWLSLMHLCCCWEMMWMRLRLRLKRHPLNGSSDSDWHWMRTRMAMWLKLEQKPLTHIQLSASPVQTKPNTQNFQPQTKNWIMANCNNSTLDGMSGVERWDRLCRSNINNMRNGLVWFVQVGHMRAKRAVDFSYNVMWVIVVLFHYVLRVAVVVIVTGWTWITELPPLDRLINLTGNFEAEMMAMTSIDNNRPDVEEEVPIWSKIQVVRWKQE